MTPATHSLDTSVVLRLLTRDPLPLFERAADFLRQCDAASHCLQISDLVLAETYFALLHHYHYAKPDALASILAFANHPTIHIGTHARAALELPKIATAKPGFVDRMIHGTAQSIAAKFVTFEKSSRKLPNTIILE